jgi:hypothetical protein
VPNINRLDLDTVVEDIILYRSLLFRSQRLIEEIALKVYIYRMIACHNFNLKPYSTARRKFLVTVSLIKKKNTECSQNVCLQNISSNAFYVLSYPHKSELES